MERNVATSGGNLPSEPSAAWRWICPTAIFAYATLETMLVPALPQIRAHLDIDLASSGWFFSALALSGAVATPLIGRMADLYGAQRVFAAVLAALLGGILLSATAASFWPLIVGQALQGLALSLIPLSVAIGQQLGDEGASRRIVIAATSSTIAGFALAGLLLRLGDYKILYWISFVPIACCLVAVLVSGALRSDGKARSRGSLDFVGATLLGTSIVLILTGIGRGPYASLVHLALAAALLALWWRQSGTADDPLIDRRLLRDPLVARVAIITAMLGMGAFGSFVLIPVVVEAPLARGGLGGDASLSGFCLAGFGVAGALSPLFAASLRRRFGVRVPMLFAILLILAGLASLALPSSASGFIWVSAAVGAGIGLSLTHGIDLLIMRIPPERLASASALIFVAKSIGHASGAQAVTVLIGDPVFPAAAFGPVALACGFCLVALAAALRLPALDHERPYAG